jgi:hypothetical protein
VEVVEMVEEEMVNLVVEYPIEVGVQMSNSQVVVTLVEVVEMVEEEIMYLVVEYPIEVGVQMLNSQVVVTLVEEGGSQNLAREHQGLKTFFFFSLSHEELPAKRLFSVTRRKLHESPRLLVSRF